MEELIPFLGKEIIKKTVSLFSNKIESLNSKDKIPKIENIINDLPEKLEIHCIEIINWACTIPLMGFSNPKSTEYFSTELEIESNQGLTNTIISEDDFLNEPHNSIIIGSPGAGKTTTIKRLILKFFNSEMNRYSIPILIRLRKLKHETISLEILDILGIEPTYKKIDKSKFRNKRAYIGEVPIEIFMPKLLNQTSIILFLDGLDEVSLDKQNDIIEEIESLGLRLNNSKIVFSVRKSHFVRRANHFNYYLIKSLTREKIIKISQQWLNNTYNAFLDELDSKPYTDLANRPIFLTILLVLFEKEGVLPEEPHEVYEEMTFLVIRDWDEQRGIFRRSKYSGFSPRAKLKFLAEIAFKLTYKLKTKTFSTKQLEEICKGLFSKYSLPSEEIRGVVSEIESHNGIISEINNRELEFSHLSIQEYLCARHILTLPFSKEVIDYFHEYPEPLAIAICLSPNPNEWFANLIRNRNLLNRDASSILKLLSRLIVEAPVFSLDHELGYTILQLMIDGHGNHEVSSIIIDFLKIPNVKESFALILKDYHINIHIKNTCTLSRISYTASNLFVTHPAYGDISFEYLNILADEGIISKEELKKLPTTNAHK